MFNLIPFISTRLFILLFALAAGSLRAETNAFHTRAIWVDPASFASAKATDALLASCVRAKINLILPNVMCYRTVAFKSPHFRGKVTATDKFDPLANLLQKARALGIQVQPWSCVYYEGGQAGSTAPRFNRSINGLPFEKNFLSPSNPEVNPYLLSVLKDLLAYDIDGIHLDYIRYPGTAFDYSEAGRKAFKADAGFDPQDFIDHPERIVKPAQEKFPIRVLHPKIYAEKVWEITHIERTLDQAELGFAFISENAASIQKLRVPGLLIISSVPELSPATIDVLAAYVTRGGNILWAEAPSKALANSVTLQKLTGVSATRWLGKRRLTLRPAGEHPLTATLPTNFFSSDSVSEFTVNGAQVLAQFENGSPAITLHRTGKGHVLLTAFHLMKSTSPVVVGVAKSVAEWLEKNAGITALNPLAEKRAQWVKWRGERVTQLVRDLSIAAKKKNPKIAITSSGGPSAHEFYSCYRDAGRWLAEGINDHVFPMNYTPDPVELSDMLELQTASAPPGKVSRIFPGLQIYTHRVVDGKRVTEPMSADMVAEQLRVVKQHGYEGFCLFASDYLTEEIIAVVRQAGEATPK